MTGHDGDPAALVPPADALPEAAAGPATAETTAAAATVETSVAADASGVVDAGAEAGATGAAAPGDADTSAPDDAELADRARRLQMLAAIVGPTAVHEMLGSNPTTHELDIAESFYHNGFQYGLFIGRHPSPDEAEAGAPAPASASARVAAPHPGAHTAPPPAEATPERTPPLAHPAILARPSSLRYTRGGQHARSDTDAGPVTIENQCGHDFFTQADAVRDTPIGVSYDMLAQATTVRDRKGRPDRQQEVIGFSQVVDPAYYDMPSTPAGSAREDMVVMSYLALGHVDAIGTKGQIDEVSMETVVPLSLANQIIQFLTHHDPRAVRDLVRARLNEAINQANTGTQGQRNDAIPLRLLLQRYEAMCRGFDDYGPRATTMIITDSEHVGAGTVGDDGYRRTTLGMPVNPRPVPTILGPKKRG